MRIDIERVEHIVEPYDIGLYFSIFKKHEYAPMTDKDFCSFCKHSYEYHVVHEVCVLAFNKLGERT